MAPEKYVSPYERHKRRTYNINYKHLGVLGIFFIVILGLITIRGGEAPTTEITGEIINQTETLDCPVYEECISEEANQAELKITSTKFNGVRREYLINTTIEDEVIITPFDSDFLHDFYIMDNHGQEKIKYKGKFKGTTNLYFDIDDYDFKIGTYFDDDIENPDTPQKIYFLSEEKWILSKSSSDIILGKIIFDDLLAKEEKRLINGDELKVETLDENSEKTRIKIGSDSETIDEDEMQFIGEYYVLVENVYENKVHLKVFESEVISNNKYYNDNWKYFFDDSSLGIKNSRDLEINDSPIIINELEIKVSVNKINYEEVRFDLIKDGNNYKAIRMETDSDKIRTNEGNLNKVYIFNQNKQCKTLACTSDEYIDVYGLDFAIYIPIEYDNYDIILKEPNDEIIIDVDSSNAEIDEVRVLDYNDNEIEGTYTLFGSKMKKRDLIDGEITIEIADKLRKVELSIGKEETETQEKTLEVDEEVNIEDINIKLNKIS